MPIQISGRTMPLSPDSVQLLLQNETDRFGTFFSLDRILYHEARYAQEAGKRYKEWRAMAGNPYLQCTQRAAVRDVLISRFNVPGFYFQDKYGRVSMDKEVVSRLLQADISEDAHHFLELYKDISAAAYMVSYLGQYKSLPMSVVLDADNERMVIAHPTWQKLSTSRFSASKPSVQNINRDLSDIYTAPKGWQLVFSDSGQIEPRITYSVFIRDELIIHLIKEYDDAYYGLLHYIQLSPEEESWARAHLSEVKAHEVTSAMKEKRQRLKVLGLAGNYGSSNLSAIDAELGPLYEQKIVAHPLRREWEQRVKDEVRQGAECFYGYFGTPVRPEETQKHKRGSSTWAGHLIRCGINNPVQTTAAELMCFSVYNAKQILGPQDHIGSYKHDEGMFYVREDRVEELAPKLKECLSYHVDGWIPIGSDLHIGRKETPYAPAVL